MKGKITFLFVFLTLNLIAQKDSSVAKNIEPAGERS